MTQPFYPRAGLSVRAQQDPPDIPKEESRRGNVEWLQTILSRFGPMTDRPQNQFVLDFEKPLVELDSRIREVSFSSCYRMQPQARCIWTSGGGGVGCQMTL